MYHIEAIENAFNDIDKLISEKEKLMNEEFFQQALDNNCYCDMMLM